jgi:hypothetical protein
MDILTILIAVPAALLAAIGAIAIAVSLMHVWD